MLFPCPKPAITAKEMRGVTSAWKATEIYFQDVYHGGAYASFFFEAELHIYVLMYMLYIVPYL